MTNLRMHFMGSLASQLDVQDFDIPYRSEATPEELRQQVAAALPEHISREFIDSLFFFAEGKLITEKTSMRPDETILIHIPIFGG